MVGDQPPALKPAHCCCLHTIYATLIVRPLDVTPPASRLTPKTPSRPTLVISKTCGVLDTGKRHTVWQSQLSAG